MENILHTEYEMSLLKNCAFVNCKHRQLFSFPSPAQSLDFTSACPLLLLLISCQVVKFPNVMAGFATVTLSRACHLCTQPEPNTMADKMSDRMSVYETECQMECQNKCKTKCRSEFQIEIWYIYIYICVCVYICIWVWPWLKKRVRGDPDVWNEALSASVLIRTLSWGLTLICEGSLEVKLPTIWTDEKQMGRVREKRRVEERRSEKRKNQKKEDADARKGRKVAKHCLHQRHRCNIERMWDISDMLNTLEYQ